MSLYELFEMGAKNNSSKQAICFCNGEDNLFVSYSELSFLSHKIFDALESMKLLNRVIAVVISTGINLVTSLLGILKSKNCFYYLSPLDLKAPKRFAVLKDKIKFNYCLVDSQEIVDELMKLANGEANVYRMDDLQMFIVEFKGEEKLRPDIAYVVTTSGSTGIPKIVYVPNKSIVPNILDVVESFHQTADDVVFLSSPMTFDPSYVQMFTTFLTGSCLLLVEDTIKMDSKKLLDCLMTHHKVTIIQATPSLISMFGDEIRNILMSATTSLRILALGGEKCPSISTLVRWKADGNQTRIFNIYGITEVSCWATIHEISSKEFEDLNGEVCLGRAMDKTMLDLRYFNNETNEGELWIGGDERACLLDEEDCNEDDSVVMRPSGDIVRKDEQGLLYYIGRTDGMIKRMGKRMHLQELDKVVSNMENVSCSASLWSEQALILFVVQCSNNAQQLEDKMVVREDKMFTREAMTFIKSWLPPHYLPTRILLLYQMPLNSHGKIDRKTLLKVYSDFIISSDSRQSDISDYFMELVSHYLCISPLTKIHLQKNWIQLGGNSIMALSVYLELQKRFPSVDNLLLDTILNGTTICDIAEYLLSNENIANRLGNATHDMNDLRADRAIKQKREYNGDIIERKVKRKKISEEKDAHFQNLRVISRALEYFSEIHENSLNTSRIQRIRRVCKKSEQVKEELNFHECWKFDTGKCVDASPLIVLGQDKEVFIGSHSHSFFSLNLSSGTCNWETKLQDRIESSACLSKCTSFIITGCYSGNIYVLERSTGNVHWTFHAGNSIKSSPVVHPETGFVYVGCHDGAMYALDIQNKICVWNRNLNSGALFSSPCFSSDSNELYVGSLGGVLFCIDAGSGSEVWNINLEKPVFSSPSSSGCYCFVGCVDGYLYAINTDSQQIAWTFKTDGPIFSSPKILLTEGELSLHAELVIIGSYDKHVYCIDTNSASMIWKRKLDSEIYSIPSFLPKMMHGSDSDKSQKVCAVLACSIKGQIHLLDVNDGIPISTFNIGSEVFSSPCTFANKVLVGCRDNFLHCLEIK